MDKSRSLRVDLRIPWRRGFQPQLEHLEPRLQLGDTLLGLVFPGTLFDSPLADSSFILQPSPLRKESVLTWSRTRNDINLSSETTSDAACESVVTWSEDHIVAPGGATQRIGVPLSADVAPDRATPRRYVPPFFAAPATSGSQAPPGNPLPRGSASPVGASTRQSLLPLRAQAEPGHEDAGATFPNGSSESMTAEENYGSLPFYFEQNTGQADKGFDFVARGSGYTLGLSATTAMFSIPNVGCVKSAQTHRDVGALVRPRGLDAPYADADCVRSEPEALATGETPPLVANASNALGAGLPTPPIHRIRMQIVGADPNAPVTATDPLITRVNYFLGNDPNEWHTNVPTFAKVQYDDVYPGIDLVYYSTTQNSEFRIQNSELNTQHSTLNTQNSLEYDFVVSPGADPNQIQLSFSGTDSVEIDANGDLVLQTGDTELRQHKPYIYQEVNGQRQQVAGEFKIENSEHLSLTPDPSPLTPSDSSFILHPSSLPEVLHPLSLPTQRVSFEVGQYDSSRPLVIDPLVLGYSTYLGTGNEIDAAYAIAVDDNGHAYVTGQTRSIKFPTTEGSFDQTYNSGVSDAFVAKLNADGSGLLYATYLGGANGDQGGGIAVDAEGHAYVTGGTLSNDFPATPGAFDPTYNGPGFSADVFVTKLNPDGSTLIYSTFMGGRKGDFTSDIVVDDVGSAYVFGNTSSINFPTTQGAFDNSYNEDGDLFVAKFAPAGNALVYASYLGGANTDTAGEITIDARGSAYVTGATRSRDFPTTPGAFDETYNADADGFITKINPDGSALLFSTYLGGKDDDSTGGIVVHASGAVYVGGGTFSANFPTTPGAYQTHLNIGPGDGFLAKLNRSGAGLVYSTLYGGSGSDGAGVRAVDADGNVYLAGNTSSSDFPTTPDAIDRIYNGGGDVLLLTFNATGSALLYASYFGGSNDDTGWDSTADRHMNLYVAGQTESGNLPTTPNALKRRNRENTIDGFVTKFVVV